MGRGGEGGWIEGAVSLMWFFLSSWVCLVVFDRRLIRTVLLQADGMARSSR